MQADSHQTEPFGEVVRRLGSGPDELIAKGELGRALDALGGLSRPQLAEAARLVGAAHHAGRRGAGDRSVSAPSLPSARAASSAQKERQSAPVVLALAAFIQLRGKDLEQFGEAAGAILAARGRPIPMGDGTTRLPARSGPLGAREEDGRGDQHGAACDEVLAAAAAEVAAAQDHVAEIARREPPFSNPRAHARWASEQRAAWGLADSALLVLERTPAHGARGVYAKLRAYLAETGLGRGPARARPRDERVLRTLARDLQRMARSGP